MMPGKPFIPEVPAKPSYSIYRLMINVVYTLCSGTTVRRHFLVVWRKEIVQCYVSVVSGLGAWRH